MLEDIYMMLCRFRVVLRMVKARMVDRLTGLSSGTKHFLAILGNLGNFS